MKDRIFQLALITLLFVCYARTLPMGSVFSVRGAGGLALVALAFFFV